ncbi:dynactin P62 subunit [Culex quinquefasciatus]|uniref:Dynactin P62 subunit n=1 Tax=Culex quinquefasciatus TaxID=7176 RepID=B0XII2_CULQU|nr:dynactin P62 subunit [Culex quinquefasciatus]|eukprot:XP_001869454.1 dynactin P62 subunit [Culex quinquefasciatus]
MTLVQHTSFQMHLEQSKSKIGEPRITRHKIWQKIYHTRTSLKLHGIYFLKIRGLEIGEFCQATDSAGWKIPGINEPANDCNGTSTNKKLNPMGVRKRHAEEEQLLVAKRTSAGVVHEEGKHDQSDLRCDWGNIAILFFLYLLQGIPIGLAAAAIPMMLQNRGASYKQQVPTSAVGCCGRRSSTRCTGRALAGAVPDRVVCADPQPARESLAEGDEVVSYIAPNIPILTGIFFALNFLAATQNIAVDEWALKRCNLGQSHPLPNRPDAARRGRRLVHLAMIYDHHVPYYFYPIRCGYGIICANQRPGHRRNVHGTAQHPKQSGRKLANHRGAVECRRADVAATAGEEGKKEEPPTAGNQGPEPEYVSDSVWTAAAVQVVFHEKQEQVASEDPENEQVSELDGSNRAYGMGWTEQIKATPSLINRSICDHNVTNQDQLRRILLLKLINPTINDMIITIIELPTDEEERLMIEELKLSAETTISSSSSLLALTVAGLIEYE